ncbi:MAG: hypothetical protein ACYTEV_04805 [Planctomycetota bacterium]|jgi:hypothetical protein
MAPAVAAVLVTMLAAGCSSPPGEAVTRRSAPVPMLAPLGPDALAPARFPATPATRTATAERTEGSGSGPLIR